MPMAATTMRRMNTIITTSMNTKRTNITTTIIITMTTKVARWKNMA